MAAGVCEAQAALRTCDEHQEEEVEIYCKTCKISICSECVRNEHYQHDFITIAKLYRKLNNNRSAIAEEIRKVADRKLLENQRRIRETECRNQALHDLKVTRLENNRMKIKNVVDDVTEDRLKDCEANRERNEAIVKKIGDKDLADQSRIHTMIDTFESSTMVGLDLIEYHETLQSAVSGIVSIDLTEYEDNQTYQDDEFDKNTIGKIVGGMVGDMKDVISVKGEVTQISSLHIGKTGIEKIEADSPTTAWLAQKDDNDIKWISKDGFIYNTVSGMQSHSHIFTIDESFTLIVASFPGRCVKCFPDNISEVIFTTSHLHPYGVGRALNDNFLVIVVDEVSGSRSPQSRRLVQMVNPKGEILHSYEYDKDGVTPALTLIPGTVQNYNSDVCVITMNQGEDKEITGKLCVFFEDGGLKFSYRGCGKYFIPSDICVDSLCNIICTNPTEHEVQIINSNGTFLKYLFTKETCIPGIRCISLKDNTLWVGSKHGEVRIYRYIQ